MDHPLPETPEALAFALLQIIEKNKPAEPDPKVSERDASSRCTPNALPSFSPASAKASRRSPIACCTKLTRRHRLRAARQRAAFHERIRLRGTLVPRRSFSNVRPRCGKRSRHGPHDLAHDRPRIPSGRGPTYGVCDRGAPVSQIAALKTSVDLG